MHSGGATDEISREQNLADDAADLSHFGVKALSQVLSVCVDAISEVFPFCGRVVVGEWRSITLSFSTRVGSSAQTDTGAIAGRGTDGMRWGEACFVDTSSLACMGAFVCLGLGWRVGGQRRDDPKVVFADVRGSLRVWTEDDRAGARYVDVCELFRSIRGAFGLSVDACPSSTKNRPEFEVSLGSLATTRHFLTPCHCPERMPSMNCRPQPFPSSYHRNLHLSFPH